MTLSQNVVEAVAEIGSRCYRERAALEMEVERLRTALLDCARRCEALKRPCGMDPEGAQAVRNGEYMSIVLVALAALGPNVL